MPLSDVRIRGSRPNESRRPGARLRRTLAPADAAGPEDEIDFEFVGITDLDSPESQHIHGHTLELMEDPGHVDSSWIPWQEATEAPRRRVPLERRMPAPN